MWSEVDVPEQVLRRRVGRSFPLHIFVFDMAEPTYAPTTEEEEGGDEKCDDDDEGDDDDDAGGTTTTTTEEHAMKNRSDDANIIVLPFHILCAISGFD
jgi:hypothetical protein